MQLYIDNHSGTPIYGQICSQIKDAIVSGQLAAGEALPSIRALAKDLRISVTTTKRAYDELEREGFIDTLPGKGCFVAARSAELLREESLKASLMAESRENMLEDADLDMVAAGARGDWMIEEIWKRRSKK